MHKKLYITVGLLALGMLSSCYKDDSTDVTRNISVISAAEGTALQDRYEGSFGSTFTLAAPTMVQAAEQQELSYRWEVYKPGSGSDLSSSLPVNYTGRELSLPLDTYGTYRINLHVSNADNSYIRSFTLNVPSRYADGLYALIDQASGPEIGYVPGGNYDTAKDAETFFLGLQLANPVSSTFTGFRGKPSSFLFSRDRETQVYVATTAGPVYQLHQGTLVVEGNYSQVSSTAPAYLYSNGSSPAVNGAIAGLVREGKYYAANRRTGYDYARVQQYNIERQYPNVYFEDRGAYTNAGIALYDRSSSALYFMGATTFSRFEPNRTTLAGTSDDFLAIQSRVNRWVGRSLVDMTSLDGRNGLAILLRSTAGAFSLVRMQVRSSNAVAFQTVADVPSSLGLGTSSRLISNGEDLLYFATEKSVYAHIATSSAFPTSPLFTLSGSEAITDVIYRIQEGQRQLYVATSDGTTSSIYCYDLNESSSAATLKWSKTGISGKIVQLQYRG